MRNGQALLMGAAGALLLMAVFRAFPVLDVTRFVPRITNGASGTP